MTSHPVGKASSTRLSFIHDLAMAYWVVAVERLPGSRVIAGVRVRLSKRAEISEIPPTPIEGFNRPPKSPGNSYETTALTVTL